MKTITLGLYLMAVLPSFSQPSFHFSLKPTYASTSVLNGLEENMITSGFNDSYVSWLTGETVEHPSKSRLALGLLGEFEFLAQNKFSFSLAGGVTDQGEVRGFDNKGQGNFLFLNYQTFLINPSVNYHYASHKLSAGPAVAAFRYKDVSAGNVFKSTEWATGFSVSNTFFPKTGIEIMPGRRELEVKLGLFLQANFFPTLTTKEISVRHQLGFSGSNRPETFTSIFLPAKINISNFQAGISIQF
jgi:hypothetical protein